MKKDAFIKFCTDNGHQFEECLKTFNENPQVGLIISLVLVSAVCLFVTLAFIENL